MVKINIASTVPEALVKLARLGQLVTRRRALHAAMGARIRLVVQDHFLARNAEPNKQGWPKTGFFGQFAQVVTVVELSDAGGAISIADPTKALARKIKRGGPIVPKEAKYLAIPANAAAYGKSPRDFPDLNFAIVPGRGRVLVRGRQTRIKVGRARKDGTRRVSSLGEIGGEVMFLLRRSTNPPADPRALPTDRQLADAAVESGETYYAREVARLG